MISAALQVKSQTPAGFKSLSELHVAKFGAQLANYILKTTSC